MDTYDCEKTYNHENKFTAAFDSADEKRLVRMLKTINEELESLEDYLDRANYCVKRATEQIENYNKYKSIVREKLSQVLSKND